MNAAPGPAAPGEQARTSGHGPAGSWPVPLRPVVDAVVLLAALVLAVSPLLPVFGGATAVPSMVVGLVAGTVLALVGAWRRWAWWAVAAVAVGLVVLLGTPLVGAPTVAGVVPSADGVGQVVLASWSTWKDVLTLDPPLGAQGDVLLAPFLLLFCGALVALSLALRTRASVGALGAVVVVAVLAVSVLLGTATAPVPPLVTGAVLVVVLLGWASLRAGPGASLAGARRRRPAGPQERARLLSRPRSGMRRRPLSVVVLLAMVVVGALAVGPVVVAGQPRYVPRDHVVPPFDPTAYPSPLAGFRSYVKDDNEVLFTVRGLPQGARVRLAVLDRYDGTVWNVAGGQAAQGSGEFRRVGTAIDTSDKGVDADVTFTIKGLTGVWLPTVGSATSFDMAGKPAQALRYNDATGAAVLTSGVNDNLSYTESVVVPNLGTTDAEVGSAGSADVVLPTDTGVPGSLARQAASVAQDAKTPVAQVRALASWLSDTGYFSDGLDGQYPSMPGHGAARMSRLLDAPPMVGDSEQYASALALMARSMNLKSRVVLGFVPGAGDAQTAAQAKPKETDGVIEVRGKDVQAWVEVAFAGIGWVAFDATPPTSRQATEQQQDQRPQAQPQVLQPPVQPPAPQTEPQEENQAPQTDGPSTRPGRPAWLSVVGWSAGGLGVLLLLASPVLVVLGAKLRRRQRRRRAARAADAMTGAWAELVDVAVDLRRAPSRVHTRRESARVVGAGTADPALPGRLDDLAVRADQAAFAPHAPSVPQVDQYWSDVDEAVATMWRTVRWRARVAGRVSIRSLRRRDRGDRPAERRQR